MKNQGEESERFKLSIMYEKIQLRGYCRARPRRLECSFESDLKMYCFISVNYSML